jgi:hypothetical protein
MEENLGGYRDLVTERTSVCAPAALVDGAASRPLSSS